ncbi:mannose-1-phosphate guanylyltransferase/mannose-6-phosphate isomerase [Parasphingorhabdus cellanae]|uniref:Mannose-1-phosphate guanylyltransferase/mannose-6-phosphate isomerase n=1 Tax=Parasphingorhabdus cellanae TaxID=2806553 RepID=A0ABX7T427_9SPHN|nr:mannose-1-phosphate guanylyltransferase/mannose-6-phosphate isomerase [Parasphingorhabdus cellanae]QTD55886.1 mannose-1-phosphate guanylyltransferase/mannose-6-phosphate isomerase [Parasphingorhabdus cellanae]
MSEDNLITPVILSGGSGTRLWPVSTDERPKQFLNLTGSLSMFQLTLERCQDTSLFDLPIIVGGAKHADLAEQQMGEIGAEVQAHILEPCARNTAPAIALAALACRRPQNLLLVMPSDHVIKDVPAFQEAIRQSVSLAKARWLVTFGIEPRSAETGYGYIQQGEPVIGSSNSFAAQRFVEKPNHSNAEKMLAEGGYYWNAGIFLFRADTYLEAMAQHAPEMLQAAKNAMEKAARDQTRIEPNESSFANAPSDSIDYAIMEKAEKVAVTPINPGWSDVGSWDSLFEISQSDDQSNVTFGDVVAVESKDNLIHSDGLEITTFGLENLIIVASGKKVMILPKGQSQNVRKIVTARRNTD